MTVVNFLGWSNGAKNGALASASCQSIHLARIAFAFLFCYLTPVAAANFTVTTIADNESDGCGAGQCTLREAVTDANQLAGNDTITFQAGLSGTIVLLNGHLPITSDLSIIGPGARNLTVSGNNAGRVFVVFGAGTTANISGLTISGGNAQPILISSTLIGDGGGILNTNGATLNLTEVNVTGNSATSLGGGIATRAILGVSTVTNITRSLISDNDALAGGGGVSNVGTTILSSAVTTISNSTVTDNDALAEGGGISNVAGILNLTNDTVSHNESVVAGGGIVNAAGILVGVVNIRNTILARNEALLNTSLISSDGLGIFNSMGNNLVGNNLDIEASFTASVIIGNVPQPNANADIVGSVAIGFQIINPFLGNLLNNGGPTDTRALITGSPAIDRGNNCVGTNTCPSNPQGNNPPFALNTDQRSAGFVRIHNLIADIGAYEFQLIPSSAAVSITGRVLSANDEGISGASVSIIDASGIRRASLTNQFGYFDFQNIPSGETYIVEAAHKQYVFTPRVITLNEDLAGLDITAQPRSFNERRER